jgi:hypothetical protein
MTAHRDANIIGLGTNQMQGISLTNPVANKFGKSADFVGGRRQNNQISSRVAVQDGNNDNQEMCYDDAMSVDGDISYCSIEMDEIQDKTGQFIPPLKYRESNSSLHLVEKKEKAVESRMFI